jgi:hypothetical protein
LEGLFGLHYPQDRQAHFCPKKEKKYFQKFLDKTSSQSPVSCEGRKHRPRKTRRNPEMKPNRGGPKRRDDELVDTLMAISVVAKRMATRIRTGCPKKKETGVKNGQDKRV